MLDVLVGNHPIFVSKKTIGQCPKVAETGLDDFESFMFIGSNRYRKGYSWTWGTRGPQHHVLQKPNGSKLSFWMGSLSICHPTVSHCLCLPEVLMKLPASPFPTAAWLVFTMVKKFQVKHMVGAGLLMYFEGILECFVEVGRQIIRSPCFSTAWHASGAFVEAQQGGHVAVFQPNGVYGFEVQVQNPEPRRHRLNEPSLRARNGGIWCCRHTYLISNQINK